MRYIPDGNRRLFREDSEGHWREIEWKEMKPTDEIMVIGIHEKDLIDLQKWIIGSSGVLNDFTVHTEFYENLLPKKDKK